MTELDHSLKYLTSIGDLSHCAELKYLNLGSNHVDLTYLQPTLTVLYLYKNQPTTVGDCSQCTQLRVLSLSSNHINHVDWRKLPSELTWLYLDNNEITTINARHSTQFECLGLRDNPTLDCIQSLSRTDFNFFINSSVKVLGQKCFRENTCNMLQRKCEELK